MTPRGLSRSEAAEYLGCSPRMFDGMLSTGQAPKPRLIGTKKVWDRRELDEFFEALPRMSNDDSTGNPWDDQENIREAS